MIIATELTFEDLMSSQPKPLANETPTGLSKKEKRKHRFNEEEEYTPHIDWVLLIVLGIILWVAWLFRETLWQKWQKIQEILNR
ncbi:MAG: hypothetical protein U0Y10_01965 [Spirosomataceae bacterium]